MHHDLAALARYQLIPRVLHDVQQADTRCELLGRRLAVPIIPRLTTKLDPALVQGEHLSLVGEALLEGITQADRFIPLVKVQKMATLVPRMRYWPTRGVPALALDMTVLADTPPFGSAEWRPRTREDLAELRAAAGCPLWLYGVAGVADAEVALEAGLEAVIVTTAVGEHLGVPAAIDIFPEILDAVAGTVAVYVGGPVRTGIDVFRYLAVGAEAVIVTSDRSLGSLQAELEYAMRLTGCATLADISYEAIFAPLFGEQ
jgi:isopentenyl diphosphate isomerase/L-lactate dehydrogenase-like FMN-dependent dehydrogenase